MKEMNTVESWESVSKKAYWDRDVPLPRWIERVATGHRSYLPDAVSAMNVSEFIRFYGVKRYIRDWPVLRSHLPEDVAKKTGVYDLAWSRLAGGGWNLKPYPDFNNMPKRRQQFLMAVAKTPGRSIYEVAKSLDMQYRRAHEHAMKLMQEGKMRGAEVLEDGHKKTKLYPLYKQEAEAAS